MRFSRKKTDGNSWRQSVREQSRSSPIIVKIYLSFCLITRKLFIYYIQVDINMKYYYDMIFILRYICIRDCFDNCSVSFDINRSLQQVLEKEREILFRQNTRILAVLTPWTGATSACDPRYWASGVVFGVEARAGGPCQNHPTVRPRAYMYGGAEGARCTCNGAR